MKEACGRRRPAFFTFVKTMIGFMQKAELDLVRVYDRGIDITHGRNVSERFH